MSYVHLSSADLEGKYRMALSKLRNAREEIAYLNEGGLGRLGTVLTNLDRAIDKLIVERDKAAKERDFTPKDGIGPGDWRPS
jgi:ABC-type uncharacterized transport system fused permease/ATPase subunit